VGFHTDSFTFAHFPFNPLCFPLVRFQRQKDLPTDISTQSHSFSPATLVLEPDQECMGMFTHHNPTHFYTDTFTHLYTSVSSHQYTDLSMHPHTNLSIHSSPLFLPLQPIVNEVQGNLGTDSFTFFSHDAVHHCQFALRCTVGKGKDV
jgi:hypothetical protein